MRYISSTKGMFHQLVTNFPLQSQIYKCMHKRSVKSCQLKLPAQIRLHSVINRLDYDSGNTGIASTILIIKQNTSKLYSFCSRYFPSSFSSTWDIPLLIYLISNLNRDRFTPDFSSLISTENNIHYIAIGKWPHLVSNWHNVVSARLSVKQK